MERRIQNVKMIISKLDKWLSSCTKEQIVVIILGTVRVDKNESTRPIDQPRVLKPFDNYIEVRRVKDGSPVGDPVMKPAYEAVRITVD